MNVFLLFSSSRCDSAAGMLRPGLLWSVAPARRPMWAMKRILILQRPVEPRNMANPWPFLPSFSGAKCYLLEPTDSLGKDSQCRLQWHYLGGFFISHGHSGDMPLIELLHQDSVGIVSL